MAWTPGTAVTIDGLRNGTTYHISTMSRFGSTFTDWTTPLTVTPNPGAGVEILARDYRVARLAGARSEKLLTAVADPGKRVEQLDVVLSTSEETSRSATTSFDPTARATGDRRGAWATAELPIAPMDHEVVAVARGRDGALASSIQTWVLGTVDADAVSSSGTTPTRVGTFR